MFPFLWTLDPLSQGFNFWPLRAAPSFFSVFRFLPRHRESCQTYSTLVRDNASSSLRDKAMHNATAIRSRAPVSGYSASVPLSATRFLFLTFPLPSPLFFFPLFSFFFFAFSSLFLDLFFSSFHSELRGTRLLNGTNSVEGADNGRLSPPAVSQRELG